MHMGGGYNGMISSCTYKNKRKKILFRPTCDQLLQLPRRLVAKFPLYPSSPFLCSNRDGPAPFASSRNYSLTPP